MPQRSEWVYPAELAAITGEFMSVIRDWRKHGKGPPAQLSPCGRTRYARADVLKYILETECDLLNRYVLLSEQLKDALCIISRGRRFVGESNCEILQRILVAESYAEHLRRLIQSRLHKLND